MRKKISTLKEVIRFFGYAFLATAFIPQTYSQFDVTPLKSDNNEVKEPYNSLANFTDYDLDSNYHDLQSLYHEMQNLYYNSSGDGTNVQQIYPSVNQQNFTDWFVQLLNNSYNDSSMQHFNFSNMFSGTNTSKGSFHQLANNFKVFPDNGNVTIFNITLPTNISSSDADIFDNALNSSAPTLDNSSTIYVNLPHIKSLSLNKTSNSSNMLNQFFHKPSTTSTLMDFPTPKPFTPTRTHSVSNTSKGVDMLAKKIGEDVSKNSSTYLKNMLSKLGLQNITMDSNPKMPMNFNKLNTSDIYQLANNTTPTPNILTNGSVEGSQKVTSLTKSPLLPISSTPFPYTSSSPTWPNETIYHVNPETKVTDIVTGPINVSNTATNSPFEQTNSASANNSSNVTNPPASQTNTTSEIISNNATNPLTNQSNPNTSVNGSTGMENMTMNQANSTIVSVANNGSTELRNVSFPVNETDSLSAEYGEIIYSSVFFTSGFSTPSTLYPLDPYNNTDYWPEGMEQLTNVGKNQMYGLGKWLQQRYCQLISPHYNSSLVKIHSGETDNLLSSAESLSLGLFPPTGAEIWNPLIRWQPIPIHTIPAEIDNIILMTRICQQYTLQTNALGESSEWLQFYDNNGEVLRLISNNTGNNFTRDDILDDLKTLYYIYQELRIEEKRGLTLPNWTKPIYPEPITSMAEKYIEFSVATRELQKIKTGPFFKNMVDNMSKKIDKANTTSPFLETLHLYAGDSLGLAFIMKTLGIYNSTIPSDASALIFDLRYKNNSYIITLSYKNATMRVPYILLIPNCVPICKFDNFVNVTKDLVFDDWDDDCATITISDLTYTIPIVIFGVIIVFILALVAVLLCMKCCKLIRGKKSTFN